MFEALRPVDPHEVSLWQRCASCGRSFQVVDGGAALRVCRDTRPGVAGALPPIEVCRGCGVAVVDECEGLVQ